MVDEANSRLGLTSPKTLYPRDPGAPTRVFRGSLLSRTISEYSEAMNLNHEALAGSWLHRLMDETTSFLIAGFRFPINDSAASALAQHKIAASRLLSSKGLAVILHELIYDYERDGAVVAKPNAGSRGQGVQRYDSIQSARSVEGQPSDLAVCAYLPELRERRVVIFDGEPAIFYEKLPGVTARARFPTHNLHRGARVQDLDCKHRHPALALAAEAADCLGLRVCAVDIVTNSRLREWHVLEINDGLMLEMYARSSEGAFALARATYLRVLEACHAHSLRAGRPPEPEKSLRSSHASC